MTRVKVCGLTRVSDALCADKAGVDAIGLVFATSPRRVSVEAAAAIDQALSPWVSRVGVFVDPRLDELDHVLQSVRLDVLQLHGTESPEYVRVIKERYRRRIVKGVAVRDASSLQRLSEYDVEAFLLDTFVPGQPGGTGKRFDWSLAVPLAKEYRIVLAGGLTPENVIDAIQLVRPYGVDVASGVESEPGIKDTKRVEAFIQSVRSLEE